MAQNASVSVLSLGQNGQVTIPASFRKDHGLGGGAKVLAIRMGDALVMAPHDGVIESICMRLEEAMKGAGLTVEAMKEQALVERGRIVRERYGSASARRRGKRRS